MKSPFLRGALTLAAALLTCLPSVCCAAAAAVRMPPGASDGYPGYQTHLQWINSLDPRTFDAPAGRNAYGAPKPTITVPMVFPILGRGYGFSDEFGAPRDGHRHLGDDLFAPKMTPLVAVFDGTVYVWSRSGRPDGLAPHNMITLVGDNGYTAKYLHVNNDTPGTNDGKGTDAYAFAPGLLSGEHVRAGQFLGWVGNSGNAETTPPHTHFELWGPDGLPTNPAASLRRAARPKRALAGDLPLPDWMPGSGQVRWDGIVQGVDPVRGVLVLNLLATTTAKGGTVASTRAGWTYARVAPSAAIRREGTGDAVRFSDLRPGDRVALRGPAATGGRSFVARAGAVTGAAAGRGWAGSGGAVGEAPAAIRPDNGRTIGDGWDHVQRRGW